MKFTEAVSVTLRTYAARARDIVPFYFFVPSTLAIARAIPLLAIIAAGALFQRSGALGEIEAVLADAGPISLDGTQEVGSLEGVGEELGEIIMGEPFTVLFVLGAVLSMYLFVPMILWISAAGRLHGIVSVLTDPRGTAAAVHFGHVRPSLRQPHRAQAGQKAHEDQRSSPVTDDREFRTDGGRDPAVQADSDADPESKSADKTTTPEAEQYQAPKSPVVTGSGNRPLRDAVDGTFTHATTFVGLLFVELLAFTAAFAGLVALAALTGPLAVLLVPIWLLVVFPAIRTVFALAKPAAVVEETGVVGAVRGASSFLRQRPGQAVVYGFASVGTFIGVGVAGAIFSVFDAGTLAGLALFVLVLPLLDTLKTVLYADFADGVTVRVADKPATTPTARLRSELATGWATLKSFTTGHPGLVGINLLLFVAAGYLAWIATTGISGTFEASIERRIAGTFPPGMALNYFANNWSVGIAQSYSGIAFGVPAALSVLFNGAMIGAYAQFEVALAPFVAFVLPHGLIEIPALLLSGALGLYLGIVGWRTLRGQISRAQLTDEIEYAYQVTMGLAVLFAVAGVIEAFVSPYYWQLLGI